jgi:hypothetical protein
VKAVVARMSMAAAMLAGCAATAPAQAPVETAPAATPPHAASTDTCPPGALEQWRADYCMATTGTDDIIAAGQCLETEDAIRFPSDCAGKRAYKRRMCELARDEGPRQRPVDACVADPGFMGPTVRNNGT